MTDKCTYQPSCEDDRKCCTASLEADRMCWAVQSHSSEGVGAKGEPEVSNKASGLG